jgi:hypothetical protein
VVGYGPFFLCVIHKEDLGWDPLLGQWGHLQADEDAVILQDYLHTYIPLTLYPRRGAEASLIFLRDAHVLPKLFSYE